MSGPESEVTGESASFNRMVRWRSATGFVDSSGRAVVGRGESSSPDKGAMWMTPNLLRTSVWG